MLRTHGKLTHHTKLSWWVYLLDSGSACLWESGMCGSLKCHPHKIPIKMMVIATNSISLHKNGTINIPYMVQWSSDALLNRALDKMICCMFHCRIHVMYYFVVDFTGSHRDGCNACNPTSSNPCDPSHHHDIAGKVCLSL